MRKERLDGTGFAALMAVSLLLAANQIIIKEVNAGLQPVFFAGARSALAVVFVWAWLKYRGLLANFRLSDLGPGLLIGVMFAGEFLCLFMALDLTSVGHASLIMYSMPLWMALLAHFFLPGEALTPLRSLGLVLAFLGTGWAILSSSGTGNATLTGDIFALGAAWGWAGTAFLTRVTRLRAAGPEVQLFWMVLVSAPVLLLAAPLFGPLLRAVEPMHWFWLLFQASVVVARGFISWLWLLSVYPTATVASFSFLSPVFALLLGVLIFGESVTLPLLGALVLVSGGIVLINRRP
jgi:drug/metabolite transporter (DMT)-like permease